MRKIICSLCLLLIAAIAAAHADMRAFVPTGTDADYAQQNVAVISLDGLTFGIDSQWNIVGWQAPVTLDQEASNPSAQVVDAYSTLTPIGEFSMTLVCFRWPIARPDMTNDSTVRPDMTNNRSNCTYNSSSTDHTCSFTSALAVIQAI